MILYCVDWEKNYPMTEVTALDREKSDHTPLFMDTEDLPKTDPIFRFENSQFLRDGVDKIVIDTWNYPNIVGSSIERWQKNEEFET